MSEDAQEDYSTHDEHDQHNSISVDEDEDYTARQEDALEGLIEYIKTSAREAGEKMLTQTISQTGSRHRRI